MRSPDSTEKCHTLWDSAVTAVCGFGNAVRHEKKVRHVLLAMLVATVISVIADVGYFQISLLLVAWMLPLICELFNTALEKALDYTAGKEIHPLIRQGKDYGSACTFVALTFAIGLTLCAVVGRVYNFSDVF